MKNLIYILLLISSSWAVELNLHTEGVLDNREYFDKYDSPGTIFGVREDATAKIGNSSTHEFYGGVSWFQEFGAPIEEWLAVPLLYYKYTGNHTSILFGSFIRKQYLFYSKIFMDERYEYKRPQVEGFLYKYTYNNGFQTIWADWDSRQRPDRNEMFFIGVSGHTQWGIFSIDHHFLYRHHAGRDVEPHDPVGESGGAHIIMALEKNKISIIDTLKGSFEIIGSYNRESRDDYWNDPVGLETSIRLIFNKLGIATRYYKGVYESINWHQLEFGAPFYNAPEFGEVKFLFYPVKKESISMHFEWNVVFVDGTIENTQYFLINGDFGHKFKKQ